MIRHLFRLAGLALAMLAPLLCAAQATEASPPARAAAAPLPAEVFFKHPAALEAKLSPSGRRVALTTSRGSRRVGLVVIDLHPTPSARRVANYQDADVVHFHWVSDDQLVYGLADLQYGGREQYERGSGLFAVNADGSRYQRLISGTIGAASETSDGFGRVLDARHFLLHVPHPQEGAPKDAVVIGIPQFSAREFVGIQPMWLDTRSGSTRPMLLPGAPNGVIEWMFDSRGEARLATARRGLRYEVHWRAPGQADWRIVGELNALQPAWWPQGLTDDGTLYVLRPEGATGESVLARFDFQARAPGQALLHTPGFDFEGELVGSEPGKPARGVRVDTDAEVTIWFDDPMKELQAAIDARLPGRVNTIDCRRCGRSDMVALVHSHSDQDPGRWLLYEAAGQRLQAVASAMDGIEPRRMASVDFQRIKARDGRDLPVWLTLPVGVQPVRPAPAVVLVHGGPWVRGGHWRWEPMAQFLASRGYLVIAPDFRGSTGYGNAHFTAGWKQWGQAMQDDLADALLWARKQGLADDDRACIAGASYGGYATLMGLARHAELYRCGIAWLAVTDLMLMAKGETWVEDDLTSWGRRYALPQMLGDPEQDAPLLAAQSPLTQAARIRTPLLLAYGGEDKRVPLAHGKRMRDALQAAGHTPEWVVYPDEAHGWREETTSVDFARRVEAFLQQHLANRK